MNRITNNFYSLFFREITHKNKIECEWEKWMIGKNNRGFKFVDVISCGIAFLFSFCVDCEKTGIRWEYNVLVTTAFIK